MLVPADARGLDHLRSGLPWRNTLPAGELDEGVLAEAPLGCRWRTPSTHSRVARSQTRAPTRRRTSPGPVQPGAHLRDVKESRAVTTLILRDTTVPFKEPSFLPQDSEVTVENQGLQTDRPTAVPIGTIQRTPTISGRFACMSREDADPPDREEVPRRFTGDRGECAAAGHPRR